MGMSAWRYMSTCTISNMQQCTLHRNSIVGVVSTFCSQPHSSQMTTSLIMAFQLRSRAQIFSRYLSSRRVTEKFRCSTCLLRTPHCVTVNSSRLYEHPHHNRVAQHTNRWTLAHSRVYVLGVPIEIARTIGDVLKREIEKKLKDLMPRHIRSIYLLLSFICLAVN